MDDDLKIPKYTRYLPAIYHEDAEQPESPLYTILHVLEDIFGGIEIIIDHIEQYFDVKHTPAGMNKGKKDFLSWLAQWVAMEPEQDWSERKRRYVVKHAVDIYTLRGTVTGLNYILALYFGIEVETREWTWPQGMQIGVRNTIGWDTVLHERPNLNFCFVIIWKAPPDENELIHKIKKIRARIDREKPAHTKCYFHVKPGIKRIIKNEK